MSLRFKVLVEVDEDGMFCVSVPALPGCFSAGRTQDEALENVQEAIALHLEALEELAERPRDATLQEVIV